MMLMSVAPWPDHLLTLEEWDALPEDTSRRIELAEGVLQVSASPLSMHQRAANRLVNVLEDQLPDRLTALHEVDVVVSATFPPTVRIPDVVVTHNELAEQNPARYDAADILLAIEIVSPGSRRRDHVTKLDEYAEAGIRHYWVIDIDDDEPPMLSAFLLVDGYYEIIAKVTDTVQLSEPAPVTVDVRKLTARR
jgi:Uma2 family endonuclease